MSDIQEYLDDIMNAVYGEEVRSSIVGAIQQCYEDGSAGAVDANARARLDAIEPVVSSTATTANANVVASLQAEKKLSQDGIHDLNLCVETGKYYADTTTVASGVTNQPSDKTTANQFAVLVLNHYSANSLFQMLVDTDRKAWLRLGVNSSGWTFGNWQRILDDRDRTAIESAIALKAPLASPALTGNPTAPTQAAGNSTTRLATTAFVTTAINNFKSAFDSALSSSSTNAVQNKVVNTALAAKAPLASPALTGNPTAPTQAAGNNSTRIATTAFVTLAVNTASDDIQDQLSDLNGRLRDKADIDSPVFSGTPQVPTPAASSDNLRIANTAFVQTIKDSLQSTVQGWMYYKNNDTQSLGNYSAYAGYCGGSKRRVDFTVPVPKSLKNVTGIEVTAITGALQGATGAIQDSTYTTNWITYAPDGAVIMQSATPAKVSDNLIRVRMEFGTTLDNAVNGSPIVFVATNLAFKFYVNS